MNTFFTMVCLVKRWLQRQLCIESRIIFNREKIITFSITLFPPNRLTNSAGEATVKSLCRSIRLRSLPCFTRWSPDILGLVQEKQHLLIKEPTNKTFQVDSKIKQTHYIMTSDLGRSHHKSHSLKLWTLNTSHDTVNILVTDGGAVASFLKMPDFGTNHRHLPMTGMPVNHFRVRGIDHQNACLDAEFKPVHEHMLTGLYQLLKLCYLWEKHLGAERIQ